MELNEVISKVMMINQRDNYYNHKFYLSTFIHIMLGMDDMSCPIPTSGIHIPIINAHPQSAFLVKFLYFFRWMPLK
ncbi:hypothetical protein HanRHA438_Chr05g0246311 [Helianthus annuus]|nr:hypothetical protein HanHA300_Chr05g0194481 [Helianthus annuus]KAJ0579069.1 hypothetical protein HanIR_Chr05g0254871 [Helianthus annuus]KAJ0920897.1 hypothetical protein HanRHA438_Chr05g0246311 [Helianthus annuus]